MIRAFLSVELSDALRDQIARTQQDIKQRFSREFSKDIRMAWVEPRSIHLTIRFLGDTDEHLIAPLRETVGQAMAGQSAFQIPIERLGVFPRPQQPRVLWLGPSEQWEQGRDAERLTAFHRGVEEGCRSFGFAPDGKPFSPHLTIARVKEGEHRVGQILAKSSALNQLMQLEALSVESVMLMKSELRPTGAVYTKLWEVQLERHTERQL